MIASGRAVKPRQLFLYNPSATIDVTISGLRIQHGSASDGAGILDRGENLTLDHVTVQSNTASYEGGGVELPGTEGGASGSLTVLSSVITGNTATQGPGGGIFLYREASPTLIQDTTISSNHADNAGGGGIYLYNPENGLTLERSTLSGNTAASGGGAFFYKPGGPVLIEDSTISDNQAGAGGGIFLYRLYDTFAVRNSTIANNDSAYTSGGGIYFYYSEGGSVTTVNSILGGNTEGGTVGSDLGGNGTFALTYSLVQAPGTANINDNGGNLLGQAPLLGPLGNHGGPTQTRLPAGNSPAVNAGDPAFTPPPSTDQRGFARVVGGRIDMGAVELNPGTIQLLMSAASVAEAAGTVTITVTRTGGADGAVSVSYAMANGTATAPSDYASAAGTVNFADQDSANKTFMVTIVNDAVPEPDETFTVTLSNPTNGAALGATTVETVTITNDDLAEPIPTLGDLGEVLLAGLLATGGLMLMRRRRGLAAPLVALSLTLGGVQAADAKGPKPPKDVKATTLSQVQVAAAGVTLRLADGTTLSLPLGKVEMRDRRRHQKSRAPVRGLAGLPANQPVVIKIKHGADGSIQRVKILVFDTQQAAQAALQRKGKQAAG
ncbi:MAG: Calx-beta domain-containing protein [Thermoanaerobaculia bacterium]